jgi:hypothetical protein
MKGKKTMIKLQNEITYKLYLLKEKRKQLRGNRDSRQVAELLSYIDGQIDALLAIKLAINKNKPIVRGAI